jgi:hypothetical protein
MTTIETLHYLDRAALENGVDLIDSPEGWRAVRYTLHGQRCGSFGPCATSTLAAWKYLSWLRPAQFDTQEHLAAALSV